MTRLLVSSFLRTAVAVWATVALLSFGAPARAGGLIVLYSFTGGLDGGNAATGLVFDAQNNAYGTTVIGGYANCGTVFQLHQQSSVKWVETPLYSFSCYSDGKNPHGGVNFGPGGALYGTTVAGGQGYCAGDGCGVVYALDASNTEHVLYSFQGDPDGWGPGGPVIFDSAGNIYGMTPDGGNAAQGTVYELSPKGKVYRERLIHQFQGGKDGSTGSLGPLFMDGTGNMFGVTEVGSTHSAGTVFEISPTPGSGWKFHTIFQFRGMPAPGSPYGGVIGDGKGNLYGTTYYGGKYGLGTVFELSPNGKGGYKLQTLHAFAGGSDGSYPTSPLMFNASGDLYGMTSTGGYPSCDCGTVFEIEAGAHKLKIVHRFSNSPDGAYPYYGLTEAAGYLYGTTVAGGTNGQGTVFQITP